MRPAAHTAGPRPGPGRRAARLQRLAAEFQGHDTLSQTHCVGEPLPEITAPITLGFTRASADAASVAVLVTCPPTAFPPFNLPYEPPACDTFRLDISGNLASLAPLVFSGDQPALTLPPTPPRVRSRHGTTPDADRHPHRRRRQHRPG